MKVILPLLLACTYTLLAQSQDMPDSRKQAIVIRNVNVIPMDREQVLPNQVVVIHDGHVSLLGDARTVKYAAGSHVIDGTGKYLMPGLAEMHAHVPPTDNMEAMREVVTLFALKGVTTIRGMLGHPRHLELRRQLQRGELMGPRLYTSGPSINGQTAPSAAVASGMVREQKAAGYDFLKLHPGLTVPVFEAIVQTAREVGIPFAGHVSFQVGVWRAIDAGYASIDHLDGFVESLVPGMENIAEQEAGIFGLAVGHRADTSRIPKLMEALRTHKVWVVPTQSLAERWFSPEVSAEALRQEPEMKYMPANTLHAWVNSKKGIEQNPNYKPEQVRKWIAVRRKLIKACQQSGVGLLLGSDAPQVFDVPGYSLQHELQFLVAAGLSPYEALRTGTVNAAAFLKQADAGVVKPGAVADLILLDSNPLKDIKAVQSIAGVCLGGRWLSADYIAAELKKLEK